MLTRILNVYGKAHNGTLIEYCVDNLPYVYTVNKNNVSEIDSESVLLYSFTAPSTFHGWKKIKIKASEPVTIKQTLASYPAVWVDDDNVEHWGHMITEIKWINDPKYLVSFDNIIFEKHPDDINLTGEFHYDLKPGVTMQYYHLVRCNFDYIYLFLDNFPDKQKIWLDQKKLYNGNKSIPSHDCFEKVHQIKLDYKKELNLMKKTADEDFKSYNNK